MLTMLLRGTCAVGPELLFPELVPLPPVGAGDAGAVAPPGGRTTPFEPFEQPVANIALATTATASVALPIARPRRPDQAASEDRDVPAPFIVPK